MLSILKILGKAGKGLATVTGLGGAVAGAGAAAATGNLGDITGCIQSLMTSPYGVVIALSVLLSSFGIGRKAGDTAAKP